MAWYRTGTIAVANGSAVVTGSGTSFVGAVQPSHAITLPDGRVYEIASVDGTTQLTLAAPYGGADASGQPYQIVPTQGFAQATYAIVQQFLTTYGGYASTALAGRFADGTIAAPGLSYVGDQDTGLTRTGSNAQAIVCGGAQVAGFSGSGMALTGTLTTTGNVIAGSAGNGIVSLSGAGTGSSGYVFFYAPDRSTLLGYIGAISATGGHLLYSNQNGSFGHAFTGDVLPSSDGGFALGRSNQRWGYLAASSSTIVTSDETTKTWVRDTLTAAEIAAAREIAAAIGVYQRNDAIAIKGAANARLHVGIKAQQVWSIMASHGLIDAVAPGKASSRYSFLTHERWSAEAAIPDQPAVEGRPAIPGREAVEAGELFGTRPDELQYFLIAALEARVAVIEARLAA